VAAAASAATRPHYGGTLRVEVQELVESADPPQTGRGMADLADGFTIARWEAGRLAVYSANDSAPGGRPYLDQVEVQMGRPLREQGIDLELGKADVVQLGTRPAAGRKTWASAPVRLMVLVFNSRVSDARIREALAWAVDRAAIHNVLLQKQGEIAGALLPQWISGYAFLFLTAPDLGRARGLAAAAPAGTRVLSLSVEEAGLRPIAERVALNARDAGLAVTVASVASADVKLMEVRIESNDPARALPGVAAALGLPEAARADTPESLLAAERALMAGYHVIPLFHLPDVYGVGPRAKGGQGITPLGAWRFSDLWVEGTRP
jgi:hypothetical protein